MPRTLQKGFSTLELVFAVAILVLISLNMSMVLRTSNDAFASGVLQKVIGEQAEQTMDRISLAVMASTATDLNPVKASPLNSARLEYKTCLGYQDGQLVMGELERIEYVQQQGTVVWSQNPDASQAHKVVWSSWVPKNLDGEDANGIDDNGNGLVDEPGLSFDSTGPKVNIRLTLRRTDKAGKVYKTTLNNTVTCRN